jgi:outer membrane lipoprotein-sorting protein
MFGQYDPAARELLDKVSKNTKSWASAKIDFKATLITAEPKSEESHTGTLWQKGDKYKLVFMGSETYCNGKNKWVYMPEVEEANFYAVDKKGSSNLLDNPQQIFTLYTEGFKYLMIGEKIEAGKTIVEVELIPEKKNVEYFKIKVFIDKLELRLTQLRYFAKDGSRANIDVLKYTIGETMKDDLFVFNTSAHPNVMVVDMTE